MPSAPQKRLWAKGRSFETPTMTVLGRLATSVLNLRTDVAQTPVSIDGKMFRMTFLPAKSLSDTSDRSVFVSLKSGALLPTAGSVPIVLMGLFLKVIFAMSISSQFGVRHRRVLEDARRYWNNYLPT